MGVDLFFISVFFFFFLRLQKQDRFFRPLVIIARSQITLFALAFFFSFLSRAEREKIRHTNTHFASLRLFICTLYFLSVLILFSSPFPSPYHAQGIGTSKKLLASLNYYLIYLPVNLLDCSRGIQRVVVSMLLSFSAANSSWPCFSFFLSLFSNNFIDLFSLT